MNKKLLVFGVVVAVVALGLVAYAVETFFFASPTVKYVTIEGRVEISLDNSMFGYENITVEVAEPWFARFVLTCDYVGNLSLTWTLQKFESGSWVNQPIIKQTYAIATFASRNVYCTAIGFPGEDNFDFGSSVGDASYAALYRVWVSAKIWKGALP